MGNVLLQTKSRRLYFAYNTQVIILEKYSILRVMTRSLRVSFHCYTAGFKIADNVKILCSDNFPGLYFYW